MANPTHRHTRARRDNRRANWKGQLPNLSVCPDCNELKTSFKVCPHGGSDNGRKVACHGPQGKGNGPAKYPALRAQHAVYTFGQLKAYADGTRRVPGNDIMQVISAKLTEDEMRALASYTQGLR